MKKIFAMLAMLIGLFWFSQGFAATITLDISPGPMAPSGTSSLVVSGHGGATIFESPNQKGDIWTAQLDFSSVSPYTKGQSGTTDYSALAYKFTLYFSNFKSGGSSYVFPIVSMSGATTFMHTFTMPPSNFMYGEITEPNSPSAFYSVPIKLFSNGR